MDFTRLQMVTICKTKFIDEINTTFNRRFDMTTFVFGHKAPDTDSLGSALIWAWFLNHISIEAAPKLLGTPNTEASFVAKRWNFAQPEIITNVVDGQLCVIVDTNNPAELPANINSANITAIIDHHKLVGGLETKGPIDITIRPLACTATIMYSLMGEHAAQMPKNIKGLMLSCILSDTLEFRSPTTTDTDRDLAVTLAAQLNITISEYAAEMFAAKSDVSLFSDAELLRMDSKEFTIDGTKLRVSVLETTAPAILLERKASIMDTMTTVAIEDDVDQVLLFIIDILNEEAIMLIPNNLTRNVAEKSFGVVVSGDNVILPGVLSRKKQIIPKLKF